MPGPRRRLVSFPMNLVVSRVVALLMLGGVGCAHSDAWLARRVETSPSYRRLISQRPDASWNLDYRLRGYAVVAIGAPMDENFWHRWATLRVWPTGRVERMVICPECEEDQQWVEDR